MRVKIAIAVLIGGAVLAYFTYTEGTLAAKSSDQPEPITLKALIARGANGNANIILTDYVLCGNLAIQQGRDKNSPWTDVWIPVVPADEVDPNQKAPPNPPDPKALLFSTKIRNEPELEARLNQPKIQGMVTNSIKSLEPKIRTILQQQYPRANFDTCIIIQESRTPMNRGLIFAMGGGAALCFLGGLALIASAFIGRKEPDSRSDDY